MAIIHLSTSIHRARFTAVGARSAGAMAAVPRQIKIRGPWVCEGQINSCGATRRRRASASLLAKQTLDTEESTAVY
jgi:hypothetical protein